MHPTDFIYVVESKRGVREALVSVWKTAMAAGWTVVGDYDLTSLLVASGSPKEIKSIDICRPELARPFVGAEMLTALCMPCSVLIYSDNGVTKLAAMRPSVVMPKLFEKATQAVGDLAEQVDHELKDILEKAK
ncbi:MAG: hypothetical protein A2Z21_07595 [Candidatus Fraserbacteria bacterium RBG_16_55_9]|uniref:DUF302 domain-containing protein n=1 Tax=Fraserbacteria sp. (strain RBG_16_55_9) TaxID=1817864 RepID=A0A1F5V2Y7_FRAXR|nr:MAG: hypothetical protein A2Z21_07595 [Candidatus Fraserbacteria bacterium RBG_16_55_9]